MPTPATASRAGCRARRPAGLRGGARRACPATVRSRWASASPACRWPPPGQSRKSHTPTFPESLPVLPRHGGGQRGLTYPAHAPQHDGFRAVTLAEQLLGQATDLPEFPAAADEPVRRAGRQHRPRTWPRAQPPPHSPSGRRHPHPLHHADPCGQGGAQGGQGSQQPLPASRQYHHAHAGHQAHHAHSNGNVQERPPLATHHQHIITHSGRLATPSPQLAAGILPTGSETARQKAVLGQFEAGVGAVPGGGPMARLGRLVGRGRPLEILLGGEDIPAGLAGAAGWGNQAGLVTACWTWLMAERTWNASAISMTP